MLKQAAIPDAGNPSLGRHAGLARSFAALIFIGIGMEYIVRTTRV